MREIARIRNEHSVEIMKLVKNLEMKHGSSQGAKGTLRSKENFMAGRVQEKFIENEVERQRRALFEENEVLKKRLRAVDTIANTSSS